MMHDMVFLGFSVDAWITIVTGVLDAIFHLPYQEDVLGGVK